ncbi:ADA HAT complex component 1 [Fusarium austroafricanum]|uniref:ADA HAT complex component 1 n=1 Tax=Fusarium austroafricanum TaxID=2364996 RepID=A0A8H4NT98_9HYPO|nr:ADA HAT complex component 1 [Fusarium austroafricanum]
MFRFWTSESRGSDKALSAPPPIADLLKPFQPHLLPNTTTIESPKAQPPKRRRLSIDSPDEPTDVHAPIKRVKIGGISSASDAKAQEGTTTAPLESARDEIRHQFGLEILLKHDELRLINQELAKCQVALEQLRRCHLIPYPVNCPTPEQMLNVSAGKGPAIRSRPGEAVSRWAPPFGVVDGPYARHYAKWLIPDPSFDGIQPEWQFTPEASRARASFAEGRTTRNSFTESGSAFKGRSGRGAGSQKLQSLSSGYPQPKDKAGPCILKRADGQTVKLVCLDCNRENFSSTQGFINHCRIAHKRDFKSHEEAAVHSGHPIEVAEKRVAGEEKAPVPIVPTPTSTSASVHPFARPDMTEQQAYIALKSRIADSLKLYHQGKLPGVTRIPSLPNKSRGREAQNVGSVEGAPDMPHLSRLLQSRKFDGNLRELVADAKTKILLEDMTSGDESELTETPIEGNQLREPSAARTPIVMRVPAKAAQSPAVMNTSAHSASSKGRVPPVAFKTPVDCGSHDANPTLSDEDLDMEDADMSPNTLVSNNAPSLVSDDGEYDDTDDGSSVSGASDNLETESVSDVAEITLDDDQDSRSLRRESSGASGAVRLRKDDPKHVTLMTPVKNNARERRPHKI